MANEQNLKPWKKGQSGNPKGLKPKMINQLAELIGKEFNIELTKTDKYQVIEWMLERSEAELIKMVADSESPVFLKSIANAIIEDIKKNRINTVETIFDRIFGKAKQGHEVSGPNGTPIETKTTYDEEHLEKFVSGIININRQEPDSKSPTE